MKTLDEFCDIVKENIENFRKNMMNLGTSFNKPKPLKEWFDMFVRWNLS